METVNIPEWLAAVRGRPVREFIAYKMSRQDRRTRDMAFEGTLSMLPSAVHQDALSHVAALDHLARSTEFWNGDCAAFYLRIERAGLEILKKHGFEPNDEALFNIFELASLSLIRQVEDHAATRTASRIRSDFPVISMIGLLYPLIAMLYLARSTPATALEVFAYGLSNFGYALLAAGVFAGTFRVLGLKSRGVVLICGAGAWFAGVVLTNIGTS
jgi:hypothetical protein